MTEEPCGAGLNKFAYLTPAAVFTAREGLVVFTENRGAVFIPFVVLMFNCISIAEPNSSLYIGRR